MVEESHATVVGAMSDLSVWGSSGCHVSEDLLLSCLTGGGEMRVCYEGSEGDERFALLLVYRRVPNGEGCVWDFSEVDM